MKMARYTVEAFAELLTEPVLILNCLPSRNQREEEGIKISTHYTNEALRQFFGLSSNHEERDLNAGTSFFVCESHFYEIIARSFKENYTVQESILCCLESSKTRFWTIITVHPFIQDSKCICTFTRHEEWTYEDVEQFSTEEVTIKKKRRRDCYSGKEEDFEETSKDISLLEDIDEWNKTNNNDKEMIYIKSGQYPYPYTGCNYFDSTKKMQSWTEAGKVEHTRSSQYNFPFSQIFLRKV
jgi:hypothetical protein